MAYHHGVYRRDRSVDYLQLMLSGQKTVDIKVSDRRTAPFGRINPDDKLLLKESSGPVFGVCTLPWVNYYDFKRVNKTGILDILLDIWEPLGLRDEEHAIKVSERIGSNRYLTVFGIEKAIEFPRPVVIEKYDRRVWIADYQPPPQIEIMLDSQEGYYEIRKA